MDKCDSKERMDLQTQANFAFYELHLYNIMLYKLNYIPIAILFKSNCKTDMHSLLCLNDSKILCIKTQSSFCCYEDIRLFKRKVFLLVNWVTLFFF